MITCHFYESNRGIEKVTIDNHGKTEVCNAVSGLGWALLGTVLDMEDPQPNIRSLEQEDGYISIEVDPFIEEADQRVLDHVFKVIFIGLKQIEQKYPQDIVVYRNNSQKIHTI